MAAKVSSTAVSYGIGVQNRYSAFLDDEDAIASGISQRVVLAAKNQADLQKQQKAAQSSVKTNVAQVKSVINIKMTTSGQKQDQKQNHNNNQNAFDNNNKAHDQQQRSFANNRHVEGNGKPRYQRLANGQSVQSPNQPKNYTNNSPPGQSHRVRDNNGTNGRDQRFSRTHHNQHHQFGSQIGHNANLTLKTLDGTVSNNNNNNNANNHQYQGNNNQHRDSRFSNRSQQPFGNNQQRRPNFNNADARRTNQQQHANGNLPTNVVDDDNHVVVAATNPEDVKRRRQQKRVADLKHKDPAKREARRQHLASLSEQQPASADVENSALISGNQSANIDPSEKNGRKQHYRRRELAEGEAPRGADGSESRGFKKGTRPNRGQNNNDSSTTKPEVSVEQQHRNFEKNGERRVRSGKTGQANGTAATANSNGNNNNNKSGFNSRAGDTRNAGGFRSGDANNHQERSKPIPNFSDKLDFPSLAS